MSIIMWCTARRSLLDGCCLLLISQFARDDLCLCFVFLLQAFVFSFHSSWCIWGVYFWEGLCEVVFDFGVLRFVGEIVPLEGVAVVVVKLFGSVTITDVSPSLRAQRMVVTAMSCKSGVRPFCCGIF